MKTCTLIATSALMIASSYAKPEYLDLFPNGKLFSQSLGHIGTTTQNSAFGLLFSKNRDWAKLCKLNFPGTQMTNGAAFGDPCCEWVKGPAPQVITAWTDKPTTATVCKTKKDTAPAADSGDKSPATPSAPTPAPTTPGAPATPPAAPTPDDSAKTPKTPPAAAPSPDDGGEDGDTPASDAKPPAASPKVTPSSKKKPGSADPSDLAPAPAAGCKVKSD